MAQPGLEPETCGTKGHPLKTTGSKDHPSGHQVPFVLNSVDGKCHVWNMFTCAPYYVVTLSCYPMYTLVIPAAIITYIHIARDNRIMDKSPIPSSCKVYKLIKGIRMDHLQGQPTK
ncbi:hypothetical protein CEXT_306261 [Caerostris extrusa]|uniref:Uncharacterized protein n=1 Tax=Caerostris extrusa TaxID=172846 RepID=A0AAV4XZ59_CAEEX|nr:hypothetical protein CEXT_306261 [Caerostris extrusa]